MMRGKCGDRRWGRAWSRTTSLTRFKYASPDKDFNIEVKFRASQVSDAEVALILRAVADEIDDEPLQD